jgi:hypothetical protein
VTETVTLGVGDIVIDGVTLGVVVGVTETVILGVGVIVGVTDGVTDGVGLTSIFVPKFGSDISQLSTDLRLSNAVIPSFLF